MLSKSFSIVVLSVLIQQVAVCQQRFSSDSTIARDSVQIGGSLTSRLNEYFSTLTTLRQFNGNVLITRNDSVLLDETYNMKGLSQPLIVSRDSKFIIASVSKLFIKYAVLKLVELHKIRLEDKVIRYIRDFPNGNNITISQLMHHTSGLPRELSNYKNYDSMSLDQIIRLAKREQLQFRPGTRALYSNVGYFLLHYIIDRIWSKGYVDFITSQIFRQMKMDHTREYNSGKLEGDLASGFEIVNGQFSLTGKEAINRFETGNIVSTMEDLHRFSQQILLGRNLAKSLALKMYVGDSLLMQAGGRPGFRAYFYQNLRTKVTFIFLSNFSDIPFEQTVSDVVSMLTGKPYSQPGKVNRKAIVVPVDTLLSYVGRYALELDVKQFFTIELKGRQLVITDSEGEHTEIFPDSYTTFFDNPDSRDGYIFSRNKVNGRIELTIVSNGITLKTKRLD